MAAGHEVLTEFRELQIGGELAGVKR